MKLELQNTIKVVILAIILSFGLSYALAWTAPTTTPPAGNVAAPINTSATAQTKTGTLSVANLGTNSIVFPDGDTLASSGGILGVTGGASFSGNLNVAGSVTVGGNTFISRYVNLGEDTYVTGTSLVTDDWDGNPKDAASTMMPACSVTDSGTKTDVYGVYVNTSSTCGTCGTWHYYSTTRTCVVNKTLSTI